MTGDPKNQYEDLVKGFVDNIRVLVGQCRHDLELLLTISMISFELFFFLLLVIVGKMGKVVGSDIISIVF